MKTNIAIAPQRFSKEQFDRMECPLEAFPKTFTVGVRRWADSEPVDVELETAKCFRAGSWLARRFAGIHLPLVEAELHKEFGPFYSTFWDDHNGVEVISERDIN